MKIKRINLFLAASAVLISSLFCACSGTGDTALAEKNPRIITVSSFNMLYHADKPLWEKRRPIITSLMKFHQIDVCGTQELAMEQAEWLLKNFGGEYGAVFNDPKIYASKKEWAMNVVIFYRTSRFEVLDSGTFWFGLEVYPASKNTDGWCEGGEKQNRFCTWAKFLEKKSGKEFYFFDLHLNSRNTIDRKKSFGVLLTEVPKIAGDKPFVLVGDFNTREPEFIKILTSSGKFFNTFDITETPHYGSISTCMSFKPSAAEWKTAPIDYIFVSKGVRALNHATLSDSLDGQRPSDHMPLLSNLVL